MRRIALTTGLAATCAALLLASPLDVHAGQGYSGYEGQFTSSPPTGYAGAPGTTPGGSTVPYQFSVTNDSLFTGTPGGRVYLQRITAVNGTDVSTGAPAFTEDQILGATTSGDPPTSSPLDGQQIPGFLGGNTAQYQESVRVGTCGYWGIWVEDAQGGAQPDIHNGNRDVLNAGVVRVTECTAAPSPSRAPARTPGQPPPAGTGAAGSQGRPPSASQAVPGQTASASATHAPAATAPAGVAPQPSQQPQFAGGGPLVTPPSGRLPGATNPFPGGAPSRGINPVLGGIALLTVASAAVVGPAVAAWVRRSRRRARRDTAPQRSRGGTEASRPWLARPPDTRIHGGGTPSRGHPPAQLPRR